MEERSSKRRKVVVDLDGTLCNIKKTPKQKPYDWWIEKYRNLSPKRKVIKAINDLYNKGYHIVIFTARGMESFNGNVEIIEIHYKHLTEDWLINNGVLYDELLFGKPSGDIYIDDKAVRPNEFSKIRSANKRI